MMKTVYHETAPTPFLLSGLHQAIQDTEDMFKRLDGTIAMVRGTLAAHGIALVDVPTTTDTVDWDDDDEAWDYVEGDTHGRPESFYSWVEASGTAFYLEQFGIFLEPMLGPDDRYILVPEAPRAAEGCGVD